MAAGCPFITCAVKRKGIEFCGDCDESKTCDRWAKHRAQGKVHDSFKSYQKLADDIVSIQSNGIAEFRKEQRVRENLLKVMLGEFNEGRSKSYYCIAATVMEVDELKSALRGARLHSKGMPIKEKSKILRLILDKIAMEKKYLLKLRRLERGK